MAVLVYILVLLALTGHSSAAYCVCKDGSDQNLQKALDYACGNGADCSQILQSGACYNPNTVKNHCDYAVNSYFQKKNQAVGSCDFAGVATQSQTPPTGQSTTCVYPTSSSGGSSNTTTGTTPSTTPSTTPTTTPTTTTPGTTTTPSTTTPGTATTSPFGISPTGTTTTGINDSSGGMAIFQASYLVFSLAFTFFCILLWD